MTLPIAPKAEELADRGWLLPHVVARRVAGEKGGDPCTLVGTVGSHNEALVDPRGLVTPGGDVGAWSLDWWVGAEDRWHLPAREAAVRQRLVDHAPVVETRLRVPGGDAVHRSFGARSTGPGGGVEYLVVEVENDSPAPFALAWAIRPFGPILAGAIQSLRVTPPGEGGATVIEVEGQPAVLLRRSPAHVAVPAATGADVVDVVTTGGARSFGPLTVTDGERVATVAVVVPVAHRTTARVVLPAAHGQRQWPTLPEAGAVVRGWTAQAKRGPVLDLPDPGLTGEVATGRRRLLLYGPEPVLVPALITFGHHGEAARAMVDQAVAAEPLVDPDRYVKGLSALWRLARDRATVEACGDALGVVATDLARRRSGAGLWPAVAELFEVLGDRRAAADARSLDGVPGEPAAEEPAGWPALERLRADPNRPRPWPGAFERGVISLLVAHLGATLVDDADATATALTVLPEPPRAWAGQPVQVTGWPTAAGRLSFAVRWHGDRPALLWELDPHPDLPAVALTCGLDPGWATTEPAGETLLAPVPVAVPDLGPSFS